MKTFKTIVGAAFEGVPGVLWEVSGTTLVTEEMSYDKYCKYLMWLKRFLDNKGIRYLTAKTFYDNDVNDYIHWFWTLEDDDKIVCIENENTEDEDVGVEYFYFIHKDDIGKLDLRPIDLTINLQKEVYRNEKAQ